MEAILGPAVILVFLAIGYFAGVLTGRRDDD